MQGFKFLTLTAVAGLCLTAVVAMPALAADVQKLDQRVESAQMVLHQLMDTPDHGIPDGVASHLARRTLLEQKRELQAARALLKDRLPSRVVADSICHPSRSETLRPQRG